MKNSVNKEAIITHYQLVWKNKSTERTWSKGPMNDITSNFCILEFAPNSERNMWTYATCCMSEFDSENPIELHLFCSNKSDECVELLTLVGYYHKTKDRLNLWNTVNFGKSWQDASKCTYGLISLPYLDGPDIEDFEIGSKLVKFYWLIPVTETEVQYKSKFGVEALEEKFEESQFNYLDPKRKSVV